MIDDVKEFIKKNNLIEPNSSVVLALSGGVDSMVLLNILTSLNYKVIIAHVNHKKRLESEDEEKEIKLLAKKLNLDIEVLHLEHLDGNFQSKAHQKRYDFFINVAKKYNAKYIATAHHADDNIETILLNIMGGSNLYGYAGISKSLTIDGIKIIRPMLNISKSDIKAYALKHNIKYYEDISNSHDDYTRNRLRHHIIPKLKDECPNILDKTISYSNQLSEAFNFIRGLSENYLNKYDNTINIEEYNSFHIALKKDILCLLLERLNIARSENLINDLLSLISNNKPQLDYNLTNDMIFKKRYDICFIENNINQIKFSYTIKNKDDYIDNDVFKIYFSNNKPLNSANYLKLCYNYLVFPITIRSKLESDKINMACGHKKIKKLFIEHKIPKEKRERIPIVLDGNNEILWVCNIAKNKNVIEFKDKFDLYLIIEEK
ncbi:MAG: tRNA lysidine(34) synthetase TilS [Anaeroplasmataceae bacterium]